jgi:hypothetical protein
VAAVRLPLVLRRVRALRSVQRPAWLVGFLGVAALALALYAVGGGLTEITPGSAWGRGWGLGAAVLFAALLALGARRRLPLGAPGWLGRDRAQAWVQFHVYGGALFGLFLLFHTGGQRPRGVVLTLLWAASWWVVASGLVGVVLRKWLPRVMASGLATEVLYERIPELAAEIEMRVKKLGSGASPPVADYCRRVLPGLGRPRRRWRFLIDPGAGQARIRSEIAFLRPLVPETEREQVDELGELLVTRLELDAHWTLQGLLRGWLRLHLPVAFGAAALLVVHLVTLGLY